MLYKKLCRIKNTLVLHTLMPIKVMRVKRGVWGGLLVLAVRALPILPAAQDALVQLEQHLIRALLDEPNRGPVEARRQLERLDEVFVGEIRANRRTEIRPRNEQPQDGANAAARSQDMHLASPRGRPRRLGSPKHVDDDLLPEFRGQRVQRAATADDRPDRRVQAARVDVRLLARPARVRLTIALLDLNLRVQRRRGFGVQRDGELVGLRIQLVLPVTQHIALGKVEASIDGEPFGLHPKDTQPLLVRESARDREREHELVELVLAQDTRAQRVQPVLTVVDRNVRTALIGERLGVLVELPDTLQIADERLQPYALRIGHARGNDQNAVLAQPALHAVAAFLKPLDAAEFDQLTRRNVGREDLDLLLLADADTNNLAVLRSRACRDAGIAQIHVFLQKWTLFWQQSYIRLSPINQFGPRCSAGMSYRML